MPSGFFSLVRWLKNYSSRTRTGPDATIVASDSMVRRALAVESSKMLSRVPISPPRPAALQTDSHPHSDRKSTALAR